MAKQITWHEWFSSYTCFRIVHILFCRLTDNNFTQTYFSWSGLRTTYFNAGFDYSLYRPSSRALNSKHTSTTQSFQSLGKNPNPIITGIQQSISTSLKACLILDHLITEATQVTFFLLWWITPCMIAWEHPACQSSISPTFRDPSLYPPAGQPKRLTLFSFSNRLFCSPSGCEANIKIPHFHRSSLEEGRNRNMVRSLILLNQHSAGTSTAISF